MKTVLSMKEAESFGPLGPATGAQASPAENRISLTQGGGYVCVRKIEVKTGKPYGSLGRRSGVEPGLPLSAHCDDKSHLRKRVG